MIKEVRTSETHPLRIDTLPFPNGAAIGMTICPGKVCDSVMDQSYVWERNCQADFDAIKEWGADIVISVLSNERELASMGLNKYLMRKHLAERDIPWVHLPVVDGGVPEYLGGDVPLKDASPFELAWFSHYTAVIDTINRGGKILIHCRGGLGRTGTIAAMLLKHSAYTFADADCAIAAVRRFRPGAVENEAQEEFLRNYYQSN